MVKSSIRVVLVDYKLIRVGLMSVIEKQEDIEVIAEAGSGCEALECVSELKPDVVVMDPSMPDMNGIETTQKILEVNPQIKVIGLSVSPDPVFVYGMLKCGASGYVLKDYAFDEIAYAIRMCYNNYSYFSPPVASLIVDDLRMQASSHIKSLLTTREQQILQLIAAGLTSRQIGDELHLSIKTISTHRQNMMDKLNCHDVASLTRYALRKVYIRPDSNE